MGCRSAGQGRSPEGERERLRLSGSVFGEGGLRCTGRFCFKWNPYHQRWRSKLVRLSLHPSPTLIWGGLKAELWFSFRSLDLGTGFLPSLALPHSTPPSASQAVWLMLFLRQNRANAVSSQRVPVLLLLSEEPWSSSVPGWLHLCGVDAVVVRLGDVDMTPDYAREQWCLLEEMSCLYFLALSWWRSPLPGQGRSWCCPSWKGSAQEAARLLCWEHRRLLATLPERY